MLRFRVTYRSEATVSRRTIALASTICVYFGIGLIAFFPVLPLITTRLFSTEEDFALFTWFVGWTPHALAHNLNLFFSEAMYVPAGMNMAQNTAAPLLGAATAPLTLLFGPVISANLLLVIAMPASATAAFLVLLKWRVWVPASALGGLMYGFSPYLFGQGLGHPQLMFLPIPPFIALTVVCILQNEGSALRLGIQLGLLVTAQYLIEQEVLAMVILLLFVSLFYMAIRYPAKVPQILRAAWRPVGIGLALALALLAYPIWMLLAGPGHIVGPTFAAANPYHNDLLSFVVPGPLQRNSLGLRSIENQLIDIWAGNNATEAGAYIGIPVLVVAVLLAWHSRRSPRMQLVVVLVVVSGILSLGPHLAVDGHLSRVPLPFLLFDHLPLLNNILPSRLSMGTDAFIAAIFAFGLDDLARARFPSRIGARTWRSIALVGASLAVVVATQLPQWPYPSASATLLPARLLNAIPSGDPVGITYPYAVGHLSVEPLVWQAESDFAFRLLGGYGAHRVVPAQCPRTLRSDCIYSPALMNPPGLQQFLVCQSAYSLCFYGRPPHGSDLVAATRLALLRYDVRVVIVDLSFEGSRPVMNLLIHALGPPQTRSNHYVLWSSSFGPLTGERPERQS